MSPDEVFAAQMWPWPDPTIRRDAMGRVLFVNAAFLQLYGGSIENWRGNVITGWHAPQAPGVPYRFEVRVPGDSFEAVYDWIEYSMADGSALAVARDVTALLAQPAPVQPTTPLPVDNVLTAEAQQAPVQQERLRQTPVQPAAEEAVTQTYASEQPSQYEAKQTHVPEAESNPAPTPEPIVDIQAEETMQDSVEPAVETVAKQVEPSLETTLEKDDSHFTTQNEAPQADIPQSSESDIETAPPAAAEHKPAPEVKAEEPRDFERRALPIEDGDAVLGNNWRDAVIAKAVGAESPRDEAKTQDEPQAEAAPAPEIPSSDGPLTILLAEDNAINALLTRTLLEADGCSVDTVEDGAKAVEAAKAKHYDLIFMDMRMPNMDGLEATRKIRALSNRSKSLPIIALTANAFDDDRNACFDSGMNDFMTKPVSAEELSEMVKTWTKNREQRMAS